MHSDTLHGRGLAIALGLVCTVGALLVLLGERFASPHLWTISEWVMIITLVIANGAGHLAKDSFLSGHRLASVGFAAVFLVCSVLIVDKSIGRQAATRVGSELTAETANQRLADKRADLDRVKAERDAATAKADAERAGKKDKRGKWEVQPGCGTTCKGWEAKADHAQRRITQLEAEIAALGPKRPVNPANDARSKLYAMLGGDPTVAVALLPLLLELSQTIMLEIGQIVCFGYGFSPARRRKVVAVEIAKSEAANDPEPPTPPGIDEPRDEIVDWCRAYRARHGRLPQIPEVQAEWSSRGLYLAKSTAWRRIKAA